MKKRIITSVVITVIFALIIVTSSFIALVNINTIDDAKETLSIYNVCFSKGNYSKEDLSIYKFKGNSVRFTVVNKDGDVLFDNETNNLENHKDRQEIIDAFKNGTGTSVRFSKTLSMNMVYYSTKINDNIVVRSSVPVSNIKVFTSGTLKYYVAIVIVVFLLSLALAIKLVKIIVYPIKELEKVTAKIANGDLNKRAIICNYDEIGLLAQTFNNMADQLETKIKDSLDKQNKLEAILESMDSGVIALDNNEKIILSNPYANKLFDLQGEVIGKKMSSCIIDYDLINFIRELPDIDSREIKLFHPIEREIRVKKAPIISGTKNQMGIVITVQDITDIKRLENMRSEFVANVSHELKTPLTSIKGFSETLRYVDDSETKNKFLNIIDKEAERLTNLINDILILSNIENLHKMENSNFSPKEVIENIIDIVRKQAEKSLIKIDFINDFNGEIIGSKDKFHQLALNLIENAIKYSNENGNVKIIITTNEGYFILKVIDDGIGIPKNDIPRIFERFYRVDKSRSTRGTGLGLAIVKHIVKLFNGDIIVDSKVGVGSTFTVKIKR
ncbi:MULTISPECIES: HAMP domain-containing sensor histidine kinase [unclassified Clostridium]|uniref:HAMP domain-containing sensor histidine kinase n=1 Tax=unclassified Clostridium TaxID=2614128 RepID=UPI001C8BFB27|nr:MULTISPECIES: HAMP domain-containing sensor histidine kinase [unclassified Clostridium]MBX9135840.1 HAMP domain-containing protein [Clostridium sp. K12(2020)]MBX9142570.1 HAMP domain-containing protein [Clostridium sp. K13]MDU2288759.1 ATP-binding protein [Clostridium celatum]